MNGTGPTPAEQHLGDRLAALVDGELGHDARDRVLAHLATCHKCKAEADAQRRLKSVFAQSAPPPLSEGLLARLQGLPAEPGGDAPQGPFGGRPADTVFGALTPSAEHPRERRGETFGYVPGGSHAAALPGAGGGFRIHEVGRAEAERSPWRGRRFAFAAASAVSFAAIALGGSVPVDFSGETSSRGQNGGNKVSPARTVPGTGVSTGASQGGSTAVRASEGDRRRGGGRADSGPASAVAPTAPPAVPAGTPPFTVSILMYDSAALPPLIRPAGPTLQLASASVLPPAVTPQHTATAPAVPATAAASMPRTSPLTPLR
ncbi:anti-sigma factor family protein [Streptomyces zhihengii]|uniref:Zf-HC2 domain-containing protein n=1 Tax=Streptomyces zhihengii TaxID=1818004 RepID=A0ABS2UQ71_9ACTN|nr:zf-HC2 domain-containing protein [Streptomyces zhihengii]MBM9619519.1 zf-HC2 domain-containing protein [Streptomyces zhihengii]